MNLGEMVKRIRKLTNDRLASNLIISQEEFIRDTVLNDSIIPDFIGRHPWFFKTQVVTSQCPANTYILQMPTTLQDVRLLILHTGELGTTKKLVFKPPGDFFNQIPDPAIHPSGWPMWYTWVNNQVWLDRPMMSDENIRMIGLLRPKKLVVDTDTPDWLDDDKHQLLVYGGAGFVYQAIEDSKNAQVWFNIYEQGVTTYWNETESRADADPHLGKFDPSDRDAILRTDPINSPFVPRYNS